MLELIGRKEGVKNIAATNLMLTPKGPMFFSDTAINENPNAEELATIASMTAEAMHMFGIKPRMAMLSYSNFGSANLPDARKMSQAVAMLHKLNPNLEVDGEVQADFALNNKLFQEKFPFSHLAGKKINALIFPNLAAANISYKLMKEVSKIETVGPIIMGLDKPIHILQLGASVDEIVNMTAIAVVDAQEYKKNHK
jgi:malate dehydrogenase (oxaloacetate-decarboxylating)(NADP+)